MNIQISEKRKFEKFNYKWDNKKRKIIARLIKLLAIILIIICLFSAIDNFVKPTVNAVSVVTAKNEMSTLISKSVSEYIEKNDISYDKLMKTSYTSTQKINGISTDMIAINKVRNGAIEAITNHLSEGNMLEIFIPMGTLLRTTLFSGRGPKIPFKILKMGAIETKFNNTFETAGINQTKHTITLNISILINAQVPFYENITTVTEDVVIAESIIVGDVPQYSRILG
ncbi:MAG: sporulation protein YunB [Clostridia bacterium]